MKRHCKRSHPHGPASCGDKLWDKLLQPGPAFPQQEPRMQAASRPCCRQGSAPHTRPAGKPSSRHGAPHAINGRAHLLRTLQMGRQNYGSLRRAPSLCTHRRTRTCTCTCTHTRVRTRLHVHTRTQRTCMHMYMNTATREHKHTCTHMHADTHAYTEMHTHMHLYILAHTLTRGLEH